MPLSLSGAAFTCNSAQCGLDDAEVLQRAGAAILPPIAADWPHWQTEVPGPCCAGTVRLLRPVTTAAAPGADRGKPERVDDRRAVLTGCRVAVGRRCAGVQTSVTYSAEQVIPILTGLGLTPTRYQTPPPSGSARACWTSGAMWRRCPSAAECLRTTTAQCVQSAERRSPWRDAEGECVLFHTTIYYGYTASA